MDGKKPKVALPAAPAPIHGISFADLVRPADVGTRTRGAYTSRAYDTTKHRGLQKFKKKATFGLEKFRVLLTSTRLRFGMPS